MRTKEVSFPIMQDNREAEKSKSIDQRHKTLGMPK
uniref:Uncharacterized protein n=1 Tax=Anguilla anguilla TaxID=7936 RepID=A0A0E9QGF5_ANGAN